MLVVMTGLSIGVEPIASIHLAISVNMLGMFISIYSVVHCACHNPCTHIIHDNTGYFLKYFLSFFPTFKTSLCITTIHHDQRMYRPTRLF